MLINSVHNMLLFVGLTFFNETHFYVRLNSQIIFTLQKGIFYVRFHILHRICFCSLNTLQKHLMFWLSTAMCHICESEITAIKC